MISRGKLITNAIWMYGLQIFNTIIPLLTLPYITRIIGSSMYGEFSIALNLVLYMQVIVEYGFIMSATRKVAIGQDNQKQMCKLFSVILGCRVILLIVCLTLFFVYCFTTNKGLLHYACISVLMLSLVGFCFQQNWYFQGIQELKVISLINIMSRTISVVLIFILVKHSTQLLLYCGLYSLTPLMGGLLGYIIVRKKYKLKLVKMSFKEIVLEFKSGWHIFLTQFSSKIFVNVGITFLGFYVDASEVGVFSAIQKIPNLLILAWIPISQIMYPISSRCFNSSYRQGIKNVSVLAKKIMPWVIASVIVICIFSKIIVMTLFGREYVAYYYWVIPLSLWVLVSIINNFLGIQIMLASGHDEEYGKCFMKGVLTTIVINYAMIHCYKGNGAAIAPFLSEIILTIFLIFSIRKIQLLVKKDNAKVI